MNVKYPKTWKITCNQNATRPGNILMEIAPKGKNMTKASAAITPCARRRVVAWLKSSAPKEVLP